MGKPQRRMAPFPIPNLSPPILSAAFFSGAEGPAFAFVSVLAIAFVFAPAFVFALALVSRPPPHRIVILSEALPGAPSDRSSSLGWISGAEGPAFRDSISPHNLRAPSLRFLFCRKGGTARTPSVTTERVRHESIQRFVIRSLRSLEVQLRTLEIIDGPIPSLGRHRVVVRRVWLQAHNPDPKHRHCMFPVETNMRLRDLVELLGFGSIVRDRKMFIGAAGVAAGPAQNHPGGSRHFNLRPVDEAHTGMLPGRRELLRMVGSELRYSGETQACDRQQKQKLSHGILHGFCRGSSLRTRNGKGARARAPAPLPQPCWFGPATIAAACFATRSPKQSTNSLASRRFLLSCRCRCRS